MAVRWRSWQRRWMHLNNPLRRSFPPLHSRRCGARSWRQRALLTLQDDFSQFLERFRLLSGSGSALRSRWNRRRDYRPGFSWNRFGTNRLRRRRCVRLPTFVPGGGAVPRRHEGAERLLRHQVAGMAFCLPFHAIDQLLKKLFRHKCRNPLRSQTVSHSKIYGFLRKTVVKNQNRAILI